MLTSQKRILSLDVIRGFALFGILMVNMMSFHSPILYVNPLKWWKSPGDHLTYIMIDLFFQASFYPLYSLLFGYSLAILWKRILGKKLPFKKIIVRRFTFLFIVGFFHAFFIWNGDILMAYAVIGFFSLPFLKMAPKPLFMFGGLLYFIGNSLFVLFLSLADFTHLAIDSSSENYQLAKTIISIYQQGTFREITGQRFRDWLVEYNPQAIVLLFFTVFPLFLMGMGLAKLRILEKVEGYEEQWRKLFVVTLISGTFFKILPYFCGSINAVNYLQDAFGGSLQAVSYASMLILLLHRKRVSKYLLFFSYLGKMSLTNYLLQSIFSTMICYGYGLQLFGKITLLNGSLLALSIFIFQVLLSLSWMKQHEYGPLEWAWRTITYLKFPSWKKNSQ